MQTEKEFYKMANTNTTINQHAINPLIGALLGDTLTNCSNVLMVLEMYNTEGEPSAKEVRGLSLIHSVIRKALEYENIRLSKVNPNDSGV